MSAKTSAACILSPNLGSELRQSQPTHRSSRCRSDFERVGWREGGCWPDRFHLCLLVLAAGGLFAALNGLEALKSLVAP